MVTKVRKILSLLTASAMVSTQMLAPVQAAAVDAGSDKLFSTGVIGEKTEKAYPTPYFTATRTVVDRSEAGKTVSLSVSLMDEDMGSEPYFTSASILVSLDPRLTVEGVHQGTEDGTHKMSMEYTALGSYGGGQVYNIKVAGSGDVGGNGVFVTFDVTLPADSMPGDLFWVDVRRVSGLDNYWAGSSEKYDFSDYGFINHIISTSISGVGNENDPYIKDTGYEGYVAIEKPVSCGDVNGDGLVDSRDAATVIKYADGTELVDMNLTAADVDADGAVTRRDAEIILADYAYVSAGGKGFTFPYTDEVKWEHYEPDEARYRIIDLGMDWNSAKTYCETLGGHLVTITSQKEQDTVKALLDARGEVKNNYWIGMFRNDSTEFEWVTGETVDYTNFNPGAPNSSSQTAVSLFGNDYPTWSAEAGKWDDMPDSGECGDLFCGTGNYGFICEFDDIVDPYYAGGSKYQVFNAGVTWNEAQAFCSKLGGHLATITTEEEQKAITELCKDGNIKMPYLWTGGRCHEDRVFSWITGEPMDITYWQSGQPDNDGGMEQHMMVYTSNGLWNDTVNKGYAGITSHMGLICEWDDVEPVVTEPATTAPVTTAVTTTTVTTTTAPATLPLDNYKVFDLGMTWYEAEAYCENLGGHLMTITSEEEERTAEALLDALEDGKNSYWLGAVRDADGNFNWVTGEKWDYTCWAGGQPDNRGENALMLYNRANPLSYGSARRWNDLRDDGTCNGESFFGLENFGFICEFEALPEPFASTTTTVTTTTATTTTVTTTASTAKPTTAKPTTTKATTTKSVVTTVKTTAVTKPTTKKPVTTEKPVTTTVPAPTEAPTEETPVQTAKPYVPVNSAYYVYNKHMTWEEAKQFCEQVGGHLAVITSEEEMKAVVDVVEKSGIREPYIWLGSCRNENGTFEWITGEPMVYTNWDSGEPNNAGGNEPCMMMYHNGTWNDASDSGNFANSGDMAFVCEWESGAQPVVTTPAEPTEPPEPPAPRRLDIDGEMTVKEMNIDEIKAAGIDLDDPSNYHVFKYEINMEFEAHALLVSKYDIQPVGGGEFHGGGGYYEVRVDGEPVKVVQHVETEHEEMFMIIRGECKWLKEFYDVELLVFNRDKEEKLTDCTAELNVPKGLTLANCEAVQSLGTLGPDQMFDIHWYVRGDEAGDYDLTSVFKGKNRGKEFKYDFKSKNTLHVYAGNALKMKIQLPKYSAFDTDYMATITFENVSDKPIYNIEHTITNITQGSKLIKRTYHDGKLVESSETVTELQRYDLNAKYELGQLDPGDKIVAEVKIHDIWKSILQQEIEDKKLAADWIVLLTCWSKNPYIMGINAVASIYSTILDNIVVVHVLRNVSVVTLPESTTQVPYEVEIIDNTDEHATDLLAEVAKDLAFGLLGGSDNIALKIAGNFGGAIDDSIGEDDPRALAYNFTQATVGTLDPTGLGSPALTLCQDYYYKLHKPEGYAMVTFYTLRRETLPFIPKKAGPAQDISDFDIEVLSGDYTIDEDGRYEFTSDAMIKLTPKTPDIDALLCVSTEDAEVSKTIPVHVVDEHECSGKYVVLAPPSDGEGAVVASFCDTCHNLIDCSFIPAGATAFLTDGNCYQDIRGALEDISAKEDKNLYIFGNVNIQQNVEVPEDVTLIISPKTLITEDKGVQLVADGEVKDFSGYHYDLSRNRAEASTTAPSDTPDTVTTVAAGTGSEPASTEPVSTEPAVNYGDVNDDGAVDSLDASVILAHYASLSTGGGNGEITGTAAKAADIDADGKIDANDASAVLAYYAYLSTSDKFIAILDFMKDYAVVQKTEE